jgi:hypothetical protein
LDLFGAFEVGDGAADFQDAAVGAGAESEFIDRHFKQFFRFLFHGTVALNVSRSHLGVGVEALFLKPRELD